MQDAQVQGLQIGDCLGLWGDSEAPARGNAADASRSRIPGVARGAGTEAGLGSRCASCIGPCQHAQQLCAASSDR